MRKSLIIRLAAATMLSAAMPAMVHAADKPAGKFSVPHTTWGAPDLTGVWTNATLTTLTRPAQYKDRLVMTDAEVRQVEGDEAKAAKDGNAPTNPNFTVNDLPVDCGRGFTGTNCGYNSGWVDPGSTVMRVNGQPRTSFLTTADGKVPPRKPGAVAYNPYAAYRPTTPGARFNVNDNPETKTLAEQCLTSFGNSAGPVMLPLLYNNNYKIVQSKDAVVVDVEMVHDARVIRLNSQHRTDGVRPWWGDSIGHYEGNTLVVETTNYPKANAFQGSWENLKVTEKFTRVGADRILYQFTVSDPTMWATDWGGEYEFNRTKGSNGAPGEIYEYACHEGNYALEGMLAGAREEDRKAEAASKPQAAR